MYALGKIGGFLHLYIGQEAVAVGATSALRPDDYAVAAYREHGHCLAKGADPRRMMAELFGRRDGLCKGKGGSMHLFDKSVNFLGGHAIVGAHLPLATGVGFAIKYQGGDQVIVVLLRRRRGARGRVPRVAEPGRAVEAAGRSSSARTTATPWGPPSSARSAETEIWQLRPRLQHGRRGGGRHGRARRARGDGARGRAGADASKRRRSSRRAPTASAATPCAIPPGAVYRTQEEVEQREAARSDRRCSRDALPAGRLCCARPTSRSIEKDVNDLDRRGGGLRRGLAGAARRMAPHRHLQED